MQEESQQDEHLLLDDQAPEETLNERLSFLLEEGNNESLKELLASLHAADIADFLQLANQEERERIFPFIDEFDAEILSSLDEDVREDIIDLLGINRTAGLVSTLDLDDAVDILENLSDKYRLDIFKAMTPEHRKMFKEQLAFPEDSAGRLLEKNLICVPEFWNVGQTIDYLRANPELPDDFHQIFLVDPAMHPVGGVTISRILRSNRDIGLKDLMESDLKLINADMDQEEVAYIFKKYGLVSAPVVSNEGRMIGVISIDDVVGIVEEEAEEDIMHLGGVSDTDVYSNFLPTMWGRLPWLSVNLITAIIASIVIGIFESTIAQLAMLAVLMPIVASMGGNAGTQTLTVAVRAIATKELTPSNAWRVIFKEATVGALNGVFFAILAGVITYVWYHDLTLSIIFALAMIVTLFIAGLAGAIIPLGLVRFGADPAIASTVVLTTVTDVVAFAVFLGLSAVILL